ncbi:MAG TPA: PAS domain S-box protein [Candidatus Marinimicrobia bacterium]|nr:PAS domain S-box protein [Candidatus Neomarinimicrobiota bacterium]
MKIEFLKYRKSRLWFTVIVHLILIVGFSLMVWELFALDFLRGIDTKSIHYLYISRGIFSSLLLAIYAFWFIYRNRLRFESRLAASEEQYRAIIDNSSDGIISFNLDGIIQSWNRGAEAILGWKEAEIIGRPISILIADTDTYPLSRLDDGFEKGYFDANFRHKKGRIVRVSVAEQPVLNLKGEPVGRSEIIRDVTQRDLQEAQMRHSEKLATIGHLTAGLAHEIGNPLTAISSLVQLIRRKSSDEWIIQNLEKVMNHIQRISKIVREMVDFSRPSKANLQKTNINESIRSAVGIFRYDVRAKETEFIMNLDMSLPDIICDPDQIHQVILNIIINAVDANGEIGKRVWIETRQKNGTFKIEISDEGPGVPKDLHSVIFEPFYTTKAVGKGTGLGLSVSHGIIRNLNGMIDVAERPGGGAIFIITIPNKGEI